MSDFSLKSLAKDKHNSTKMSDDGMSSPGPPSANKASIQLNKMREANNKYKSLLKMAKERIQAQEEEIEALRGMPVSCHCRATFCE